MEGNLELIEIMEKMLPSGSEIVKIEDYYRIPAVIVADLDGDGTVEVCVAYKNNKALTEIIYVSVFKYIKEKWILINTIKGEGVGLSDFVSVAAESPDHNNLVVGWKLSKNWSKLNIYKLVQNKLVSVLDDDVYYSKLEIENMKGEKGRDNIYEFAVWKHDKLDAYNIRVYKLKDRKFEVSKEFNKEYFKGVVNYYLNLIETQGANPVYLYHLAVAEFNSGDIVGAINTLNALVESRNYYPSEEEVMNLLNEYNIQK